MPQRVAVLFPGQGALESVALDDWRSVDHQLAGVQRVLGHRLDDMFDGGPPSRTDEVQAATFSLSLGTWASLRGRLAAAGVSVVCFAGHSLGQVAALAAAGVLSWDDAAQLVAVRGRATRRCAERRRGVMVAISGLGVTAVLRSIGPGAACWIANDNAPRQVVLAGPPGAVLPVVEGLTERPGVRATVLPIDGAFHTPMMIEARSTVARATRNARFDAPSAPVLSNVDAGAPRHPSAWASILADHLVMPVRWRESVDAVVGLGIDAVIAVGPGSTVAGLVRRCAPDIPIVSISSPAQANHLTI